MEAQDIPIERIRTTVQDLFVAYEVSAPTLLVLLRPIALRSPELLLNERVRQAFIACALVRWDAFRDLPDRTSSLSEQTVFKLWGKAHHFWFRRRPRAYHVPFGATKREIGLWRFLETGLRSLEPNLPSGRKLDFRDPALRNQLLRNDGTWLYLSTIAHLLNVLGTRPSR